MLVTACKKEVNDGLNVKSEDQTSYSRAAISNPNDPNLDLNWAWYDTSLEQVTIYYPGGNNNPVAQQTTASLPWYSQGNPINDLTLRDYLPEQGWTLYLKDFGTPSRAAETPFFALYNKYSGVLRVFVYNYRVKNLGEAAKTHYIAELGFRNLSNYDNSLSFLSKPKHFVSGQADPTVKQTVVTPRNSSDSWANFDFYLMSGAQNEMLLNVYGVTESQLNFVSDYNRLSMTSFGSSPSNGLSNFGKAMNDAYEYAGSSQSFAKSIEDLIEATKPQPSNVQSASFKSDDMTSARTQSRAAVPVIPIITGSIGVIKGLVGLFKSFSGGKKKVENTQTTFQYSGVVTSNGTLTVQPLLYSLQFNPDLNAGLSASRYIPIHRSPVGIIGSFASGYPLFVNETLWGTSAAECSGRSLQVNIRMHIDALSSAIPQQREGIRVDSVKTVLINNNAVSDNEAWGTNRTSGGNSFSFLRTRNAMSSNILKSNEVVSSESSLAAWQTVYPFQGGDLVSFAYLLGDWGSAFATSNTLTMPRFIAFEIQYTITSSDYPDNDSRERVIYKVVEVTPQLTWLQRTGAGSPFIQP